MGRKLFNTVKLNEITIQQAFHEFQLSNKAKGLAEETIKYYQRCINAFGRFLYDEMLDCLENVEKKDYIVKHENGMDLDLLCNEINKQAFTKYSNYLLNQDISEHSAKTCLVGVKAFLNFCMDNEYIETFKMQIMKVDEKIKEPYSPSELEKLLKKPDIKKVDFVEYRTWVMENLYYATGMRLGASINLKNKDVDLIHRILYIERTKRRKAQVLHISSTLANILKEYMEVRKGEQEDYLFPNEFGQFLKKRSIEQAVENYNRARGVTKTSIHLFRHTFAKDFLRNGGKINELQDILDHSTSVMSMKYAKLYDIDVMSNIDTTCPLDKIYSQINKRKIHIRDEV